MNMKYYNLLAILLLSGMIACSGDKKDSSEGEETVETVLPDETNEVTVMTLKATDFNHELVSNGKLSARRHVDLRFQSAEPIATIHVKNGDRVSKGQKLAELSTFRLKNKTATSKDALERAKLELQDVLIGQGYALADSAKVPPATMQLLPTVSLPICLPNNIIQLLPPIYSARSSIRAAWKQRSLFWRANCL